MEGCGIPVFDGEGYEIWSKKMKTLFQSLQLWDLVQKGYKENTTDQGFVENKMKDLKALYLIQQGVSDYIFQIIAEAKTSKEAWEAIKNVSDDVDKQQDVTIWLNYGLDLVDCTLTKEKICIFNVLDELRRGNEEFYEPKVVAIGPNHHDNIQLVYMEHLKLSYLKHLVRDRKSTTVDLLVQAITPELLTKVRTCYGGSINSLPADKLVNWLVLDGCFIIELLGGFQDKPHLFRRMSQKTNDDYFFRFVKTQMVISHDKWMNSADILYIKAFQNDLLLMDNQIPFFIIKTLYSVINSSKDSLDELKNLTSKFLQLKYGMPQYSLPLISMDEWNNDNCHLLYIAHKTLCSKRDEMVKKLTLDGETSGLINSAIKLEEANVKLMANTKSESIFDITFSKGKLIIPCILIDDQFEIEIRNFIALELCQPDGNRYYCDYVVFMDHLIASSDDVDLLIRRGIITNYMIDVNFVNNLFMNLTKKVVRSYPYTYSYISKELNEYCKRYRNTMVASFKQKYLKSPWTFISIVAASILLLLTIAQTVFTVIK